MLLQTVMILPIPMIQGWVLDQLIPWHSRRVGNASEPANEAVIFLALSASVACYVGRVILAWKANFDVGRIAHEVVMNVRAELHAKLMQLPLSFFDRKQTGRLMATLTSDVSVILTFLSSGLLQLLSDMILAAAIAALLFVLQWQLALAAMVAPPLFVLNHILFAPRIRRSSRKLRAAVASIYALLCERVSAVRIVRAYTNENVELNVFDREIDDYRTTALEISRDSAFQGAAATLIAGLETILTLGCGAFLIHQGRLTVGTLLAFFGLLTQLYAPIVRLAQLQAIIAAARISSERLFEILDERETLNKRPEIRLSSRPWGALSFRDVSFMHEADGPTVLDRVTIDIEPGEVIGVAGPSGSGKSTFLALAARLYEVSAGNGFILLDGLNVSDVRTVDLRHALALVPQRPVILEGTLRSNLLYMAPHATEEQIQHALEIVALASTVDSFPLKLETPVGERGQTLSGGQRQRLALARTILADPAVLLMDNCLSALDSETETRVWASLRAARRGRTSIIVSHRTDTLIHTNRIIVLESGRIVDRGTL